MTVRDRQKNLLAKVTRSAKRLYILHIKTVKPACLAASECDGAGWRWNERFGHVHLQGLERMARGGMVTGLPLIVHVEQICEACLAGKQRHAPFPRRPITELASSSNSCMATCAVPSRRRHPAAGVTSLVEKSLAMACQKQPWWRGHPTPPIWRQC